MPNTQNNTLSPQYESALKTSAESIEAFRKVQIAYRERQIDDAEYLAARKAYDLARIEFDKAIRCEGGY